MMLAMGSNGHVQFSINHTWQIRNEVLIRPGVPLLDRLQGEGGGISRHQLQFNALIARRGTSFDFGVRWQSPYRTVNSLVGASPSDLRFGPRITTTARLNLNLGRLPFVETSKALDKTQLAFELTNLLDTREHVTRADGTVPAGYTRDEIDPLGRTITVNLRQRF